MAWHALDGLFSLYGSQDTVHANNICFIFSLSMSRHTGVAAEIMLAHNSPLSPTLKKNRLRADSASFPEVFMSCCH